MINEMCNRKIKKKKNLIGLSIVGLFLLLSCGNQNRDKQYLISDDQVGPLTKTTAVHQLKQVFENDSVVNRSNSNQFSSQNEIVVYRKADGRELLRLQPAKSSDSTSTIAAVQVMDTVYKTKEGLGIGTAFEDLSADYTIKRIENTLGTALIFLDNSNIYVDIDKTEIQEPTQKGVEIKASQIKKRAKVKRLWLDWEG